MARLGNTPPSQYYWGVRNGHPTGGDLRLGNFYLHRIATAKSS